MRSEEMLKRNETMRNTLSGCFEIWSRRMRLFFVFDNCSLKDLFLIVGEVFFTYT